MGKMGTYVHRLTKTANQAFGTTYATDKKILIELNKVDDNIQPLLKKKNVYSGNIQLIRLKGTVTSGTTTITIKGYQDADGTDLLLPPSSATFESAVGDSTVSVSFKADIFHASEADDLYIFAKTNSGTFTCTEVQITWYE